MRIAFIITSYNKPIQLTRLINCLGNKAGFENIFVHIDKKTPYSEYEILSKTNNLINISKKYSVFWGGNNQLLSILSLIEHAVNKQEYDFIVLLSGQDLPVVSYDKMMIFFRKNHGQSFITSYKFPIESWNYKHGFGRVQWYWFMDHVMRIRGIYKFHVWSHYLFERFNITKPASRGIEFYGGSDWWILPGEVARYCLNEFCMNKKLSKCFKFSFIPSEMFFQTVIGNSKYQNSVTNNNYRFIPWSSDNQGHPNVITNEHKKAIEESGALFARKFDLDNHPEIYSYFESKF
jgi:hypothetical protein